MLICTGAQVPINSNSSNQTYHQELPTRRECNTGKNWSLLLAVIVASGACTARGREIRGARIMQMDSSQGGEMYGSLNLKLPTLFLLCWCSITSFQSFVSCRSFPFWLLVTHSNCRDIEIFWVYLPFVFIFFLIFIVSAIQA